jgi:hypothetical protein
VDTEDVRLAVYRSFAETGRAPEPDSLPDGALRELHKERHLVLDRDDRIVMAHPFAAVPLGFSVMGRETLWWGGCAWDSFALPPGALGREGVLPLGRSARTVLGTVTRPGTLCERWQLLGLRGENSGLASRGGAWSPEAPGRTPRFGGGRDGCFALLLWLWFFGDRLGGENSRKRNRRGGEIKTRAAHLRFRL